MQCCLNVVRVTSIKRRGSYNVELDDGRKLFLLQCWANKVTPGWDEHTRHRSGCKLCWWMYPNLTKSVHFKVEIVRFLSVLDTLTHPNSIALSYTVIPTQVYPEMGGRKQRCYTKLQSTNIYVSFGMLQYALWRRRWNVDRGDWST